MESRSCDQATAHLPTHLVRPARPHLLHPTSHPPNLVYTPHHLTRVPNLEKRSLRKSMNCWEDISSGAERCSGEQGSGEQARNAPFRLPDSRSDAHDQTRSVPTQWQHGTPLQLCQHALGDSLRYAVWLQPCDKSTPMLPQSPLRYNPFSYPTASASLAQLLGLFSV